MAQRHRCYWNFNSFSHHRLAGNNFAFLRICASTEWFVQQVVWLNKQAGQDVSSIALLEICFGIYAIFLASTSFYVAQIESRNW